MLSIIIIQLYSFSNKYSIYSTGPHPPILHPNATTYNYNGKMT